MRITLRNLLVELKCQLLIIGPVCVTFLMRRSLSFVCLMFVARIGTAELSAIGLASVTANVTGFSMIVGLSGAVSTLCSQAFGAGDLSEMNAVLVRSILIVMVVIDLPVSMLWWFGKDIMIHLGQDPAIAYNANAYMKYLIPGLFANSCSICLQNWLHAQSRASAIAVIGVVVACLHPLWCYIFVYTFDIGYRGAAIANSTSQITELLLVLGYIIGWSDSKIKESFRISGVCFQNWWPFLKLGIPSLMMMMEWWASETIIFLSGTLPSPQLTVAAMAVYQSTLSMAYMLPLSVAVAGCTRVGNAFGANFPFGAKLGAIVSCTCAFIACSSVSLLLLTHREQWCHVYSSDPKVVAIVMSILPVACVYFICDGMQCATSNVLKGAGKQAFAGPVVILCYPCVAVPLSVLLAFKYKMGIHGLTLGTLTGVSLHFLLMTIVVCRLDWDKVAAEIQQKKFENQRNKPIASTADDIELDERHDNENKLSYFEIRQREQRQLLMWEESELKGMTEWWEKMKSSLSSFVRGDGDTPDSDDEGNEESGVDGSRGTSSSTRNNRNTRERSRSGDGPNEEGGDHNQDNRNRIGHSLDDSTSHSNTSQQSGGSRSGKVQSELSGFNRLISKGLRWIYKYWTSAEKKEYELVRSATDSLTLDAIDESDVE